MAKPTMAPPAPSAAPDIARRRKALGMTQPELAAALGISERTFRRHELAPRRAPRLLLLALETIERQQRQQQQEPPKP